MRLTVRGRSRVGVAIAVIAVTLLAGGGYRALLDRHERVRVNQFTTVVDGLSAPNGEEWESIFDIVRGLPGVVLTEEDACGGSKCDTAWGLVPVVRDPRDRSVLAQVSFYAVRKANRLNSAWDYAFGPHDGWRPHDSTEHQVSSSGASQYADNVQLTCYSYVEEPDESRDCLWSYYARYGQYIVGLMYGSTDRPMTREVFLAHYVTPVDEQVGAVLGLD